MPVIEFNFKKLASYLDFEMSREEFLEFIPSLGADLERAQGDELAVEFFPNRPDLYSVEGIARALRALYPARAQNAAKDVSGPPAALPTYTVHPSVAKLEVDSDLKNIRPYIGCAVITGLSFDDGDIQGLMNFQEKLHITIGRKRRKVAIGIHDYDTITPPFHYYGADPDETSFIPLGKEKKMSLREILEKHEKGKAYAHIVENEPLFPIIQDSKGYVLSFPPIINGTRTTVTTETKNIFLDLTGTEEETVMAVLNIVASSFAEMGGKVHAVELTNVHGKTKEIPDLSKKSMTLEADHVNRLLGSRFGPNEICRLLEAMGFSCKETGTGEQTTLTVGIPSYRADILHPIDLVEDVAISFGYMNFEGCRPRSMAYGRKLNPGLSTIRNYMNGIGFSEVMTLMLSSEEEQYINTQTPEPEDTIRIHNPITKDHTTLRTWLAPGLLAILRNNRHRDLPQRIFEQDYVLRGKVTRMALGAVEISSTTSFSDIKAYVESLLEAMDEGFLKDLDLEFRALEHGSFIPGRAAKLIMKNPKTGNETQLGILGELHPRVIAGASLENPVSYFELELQELVDMKRL